MVFALILFFSFILIQSFNVMLLQRHSSVSIENHRAMQDLTKTVIEKLSTLTKSNQRRDDLSESAKKDPPSSIGVVPPNDVLDACMTDDEAVNIFTNNQVLFMGCKADEDRVLRAIAALSPEGNKVFVDIGANRGYTSTSIFSIFANLNYR